MWGRVVVWRIALGLLLRVARLRVALLRVALLRVAIWLLLQLVALLRSIPLLELRLHHLLRGRLCYHQHAAPRPHLTRARPDLIELLHKQAGAASHAE